MGEDFFGMKIEGLAMKTAAPNSLLPIWDTNMCASPGHSEMRWVSNTRTRVLKCKPLQSDEHDVDFWKETKENKHWHITALARNLHGVFFAKIRCGL